MIFLQMSYWWHNVDLQKYVNMATSIDSRMSVLRSLTLLSSDRCADVMICVAVACYWHCAVMRLFSEISGATLEGAGSKH